MTSFSDKRVVVLGGAGFLGSHLCERLIGDGATVIALDNFATGRRENLASLANEARFSLVQHDITQPISVSGDVHCVFNLASPASPKDYETLWLETMRVGSLGTQHGLELAALKQAVFVQASTSEIYGDPLVHPQVESYAGNVDPTSPRAVYDEAKRYGEALVMGFNRKRNVSTRIARIFNTYGPRMRLEDGRVVPQFISQALSGADFTVFGDGTQTRSFCFVSDLIDGLIRLALSEEQNPVNLGNPREQTMLEIVEAVRVAAAGGGKVVFSPLPPGDPKQRRPDITRAKMLLGWEPRVLLEDGLVKTIEYFKEKAPSR